MVKCNFPSQEIIARRRQEIIDSGKHYILNPAHLDNKEHVRIRQWAHEIMKKYESIFDDRWETKQTIASGEVEPEAIDVRVIYDFPDLNWRIWRHVITRGPRQGEYFSFMLLSGTRLLFNIDYAKL
jgi:hypothetical protein